MSLPEIILLVSTVIGSVAALVQAWVAWKTYQKNHPTQGHNQGIDSRVSSPPKQASQVSSPRKKQINIPWGWLVVILLIYAVEGFFSAPSDFTLFLAFVVDVFLTIIVFHLHPDSNSDSDSDWRCQWIFILVLALASAWVWGWALASTWGWAWVWGWALALALASALVLAWVCALNRVFEVLDSFNSYNQLLIIYGSLCLGLGLGWLAYQIFPILR